MKLTDLIQELFKASEFTSANSLATATGQTQPFVSGLLEGSKEGLQKLDIVFDELTKDVSTDEFIAALELVSTVRRLLIEKEQLL